MQIEDKLEEIKARYDRFCKKGSENLLTLKMNVEKLLEEAKETGAYNVVEELKEILIDLSFSIEETRCNCHITKCKC